MPPAQQPNVGQGRSIYQVSKSHTVTHHSRLDPSWREIGPSQIPLEHNTHKSDIRVPRRDSNPQSLQVSGRRLSDEWRSYNRHNHTRASPTQRLANLSNRQWKRTTSFITGIRKNKKETAKVFGMQRLTATEMVCMSNVICLLGGNWSLCFIFNITTAWEKQQ